MFIGLYQHNIDDKGRLIIPAGFREELGNKIYVCGGIDNCLYVFPESNWKEFIGAVGTLRQNREGRKISHYFFSNSAEMELDKQGRIILPSLLREKFNLKGSTYLVGVGQRIEIWNGELYEKTMMEITPDEIDAAIEDLNLYL